MISSRTAAPAGLACRGLTARVPAFTRSATAAPARKMVVRFRDSDDIATEKSSVKDPKLSQPQVDEVFNRKEGQFSPRSAEMRADMGTAATDLSTMQTFDGPAPETINGRLAMLGVLTGLVGEAVTGQGLLQQTADHPVVVFLSFVLISIATYAPLFKGYTRKEPFANSFLGLQWTPQAENWNGRLAMMGFAAMVLVESLSGMNTLQAWGLQ